MKYIKILRILAAALTISLLVVALPATPALAVANLYVLPDKGKIGDSIEVYGSGFTVAQYELYFSDELASVGESIDTDVINYKFLKRVTPEANGSFQDYYFAVPDRLTDGDVLEAVHGGTYYLYATERFDKVIRARTAFTVVSVAEITLAPTENTVGTEVKVSGSGFATSRSVTIKFDNTNVGTAQTNSAGSFADATFTVPESYRGSHTVKAEDTSNNAATATFSTKQSAAITPTSGTAGDTMTTSGTGFAASTSVIISFNSAMIGTSQTNSVGSFTATSNVPALGAGSYSVAIVDGGGNSVTAVFIIGAAVVNLSPTSGYVGSQVTISGTGFRAGKQMPVIFDNDLVKTTSTDGYGEFSASFTVPARAAGTYTIQVSDGSNIVTADFSIYTSASISKTMGNVGDEVTISGIGFIAGKTVTVTYDGNQVATATVLADGTFSATFNAPAASGGEHSITVTDGINTKQFTFIMESEMPPTPPPLKPEMGIKAAAETYFDWEDVTDPSGVTYTLQIATDENFSAGSIVLEKTGLTQSEYTLTEEEKLESVSKDAPYYWHVKAIDGAFNESQWSGTGSFYVGFSLALSQLTIYILVGIGALLLGIFGFWLGRKTAYY